MSDDNIETKIDSTNDTGASDSGADHAVDRHDHSDQERSASVRESLRDAWREQTGEDPLQDEGREERRKRDEERERRLQERRAEPKGRGARAAKENAVADTAARDPSKQAATDAAQPRSAAFGPDGAPT